MLIECLIEREGSSRITLQRSTYDFIRNDKGHQVCDVLSGGHSDYLLRLDDFRLYEEPVEEVKPAEYVCGICGREFTYRLGYGKHMKAHEKEAAK